MKLTEENQNTMDCTKEKQDIIMQLYSRFEDKLTEEILRKNLRGHEEFAFKIKACCCGYSQKDRYSVKDHMFAWLSHFYLIFTLLRSMRTFVNPDKIESWLLGDLIGESNMKTILNTVVDIGFIIFFSGKITIHISECGPFEYLHFWNKVTVNGFADVDRWLSPDNIKKWRLIVYLFLKIYYFVCPCICACCYFLALAILVINPMFFESLFAAIWLLISAFIHATLISINIFCLCFYFPLYCGTVAYCTLVLESQRDRILNYSEGVIRNFNILADYIEAQNQVLNIIRITNIYGTPILGTMYFTTTLGADICWFIPLFVKRGSIGPKVVCFFLGLFAFTALAVIHLASSSTFTQIKKLYQINYSILAHNDRLPLRLRLKLCHLQERYSNGEIGFAIAQSFILNTDTFSVFVAKNSENFMMFAANFNK